MCFLCFHFVFFWIENLYICHTSTKANVCSILLSATVPEVKLKEFDCRSFFWQVKRDISVLYLSIVLGILDRNREVRERIRDICKNRPRYRGRGQTGNKVCPVLFKLFCYRASCYEKVYRVVLSANELSDSRRLSGQETTASSGQSVSNMFECGRSQIQHDVDQWKEKTCRSRARCINFRLRVGHVRAALTLDLA